MASDSWTDKLDAYVDGELAPDLSRNIEEHLRGCAACAAAALAKVQQKRSIATAGRRFTADPAFRARIRQQIGPQARTRSIWRWLPVVAASCAVLLVAVALFLTRARERSGQQLVSELADLHVATLASANPLDVVSSDRHNVKPWFEGKIPFTFNLPELQGSPFTLVGGRVAYLHQSPGAELMFRIRQHQVSLFIFQERAFENLGETASKDLTFNIQPWSHNGLRYILVGDVSATDLEMLRDLLKSAA
jgi:anti-sigma factor RsiW